MANRPSAFRPPLSAALLRSHSFFELYPFDGGASLVFRGMFDTLDDTEIARRILYEGALDEFGPLPELDFARFERWRTIEKSCWLSRCYFLASLGRYYWLTGDERAAQVARGVMLHFLRNYPAPVGREAIEAHMAHVYHIRDHDYNRRTHAENQLDETDVQYLWFDFQPASRVLHFLYSLHFLRQSPSLSAADRAEIGEGLRRHAEVICTGEKYFRSLERGDNHQSLRGLALLYAGCFLRKGGNWQEYLRQGARILNFHAARDYFPDGGLVENSPSYHCFETWHLRDACLLSRRYGFPMRSDLPERLERARDYALALCQPDGHSPVLNDGYPVKLGPFLASLPRAARQEQARFWFRQAGLAVHRERDRYFLLDASNFTGQLSHYHAGKNAVTYWSEGKPFLVDSGCPSYDDPLFADYKAGQSHSSLLVNGQGDGALRGIYYWTRYSTLRGSGWRENALDPTVGATLTAAGKAWEGVRWQRRASVQANGLRIADRVTTTAEKRLEFVYNLHPDVTVTRTPEGFLLANGDARLSVRFKVGPGVHKRTALRPHRCYVNFTHRVNTQIRLRLKGTGRVSLVTEITRIEAPAT